MNERFGPRVPLAGKNLSEVAHKTTPHCGQGCEPNMQPFNLTRKKPLGHFITVLKNLDLRQYIHFWPQRPVSTDLTIVERQMFSKSFAVIALFAVVLFPEKQSVDQLTRSPPACPASQPPSPR